MLVSLLQGPSEAVWLSRFVSQRLDASSQPGDHQQTEFQFSSGSQVVRDIHSEIPKALATSNKALVDHHRSLAISKLAMADKISICTINRKMILDATRMCMLIRDAYTEM